MGQRVVLSHHWTWSILLTRRRSIPSTRSGDDLLYWQYLRDNGADLQVAWVPRRDRLSGDLDSDRSTLAIKYHGFVADGEGDVLLAQHYDDVVFGVGMSRGIGGANWSADLLWTDAEAGDYWQFSSNLSYSWHALQRNMSGVIEYHFNGVGLRDGRYDPQSIAANAALLARRARGDSFALGRHYLAGSVPD